MPGEECLEDNIFEQETMTEEELLEETIFEEPAVPLQDYIAQLKKHIETLTENNEKGKNMS